MNLKRILPLILFVVSFSNISTAQLTTPNIDFETGTTGYWSYFKGQNNIGPVWALTSCVATPGLHTLTTGTATDHYGGFPVVGDGVYSLKLGKDSATNNADRARYAIHVPYSSTYIYSLIFHFSVVLEDPGHTPLDQPRMEVRAYDSATGVILPCDSFSFIASSSLYGFYPSPLPGSDVYYMPWAMGIINLKSWSGHTIIFEATVGGCTLGGHFGYGYIDLTPGLFATRVIACGTSKVTLSGPGGYAHYSWSDSATMTAPIDTVQNLTIPAPGAPRTLAVIATPKTGLGVVDTLYTRVIPLSPCSGAPSIGITFYDSSANCGDPDTLNVAGFSTMCGVGFQWQSSGSLSSGWTDIAGATDQQYLFARSYTPLYYRCIAICTVSGMSTPSSVTYVAGKVCAPSFSTPHFGSASACSVPDTLSVTTATSLCGITLQWQSSSSGTAWTDISGATNQQYTFTRTNVPIYYRCKASCTPLLFTPSPVILVPAKTGVGLYAVADPPSPICDGVEFHVSACGASTTYSVVSYYGDGICDTNVLTTVGLRHVDFSHLYAMPGTYSVKQVLFDGTIPVDSSLYSYSYPYCSTLPLKIFFDANNNCVFDAGESNTLPVSVEVDSNGVSIDTVSATSGLYYYAYGPPGTVYTFNVLPNIYGLYSACPILGGVSDTIVSMVNLYPDKSIGVKCLSATFDLRLFVSSRVGSHAFESKIWVQNLSCISVIPTVTASISPNIPMHFPSPDPDFAFGSTFGWNLPPLCYSISTEKPKIDGYGTFTYGDTFMSTYVVTPIYGDADTTNNRICIIDTSKSGFDPNYIQVSPSGCLDLGADSLQYMINFENTGNDTAFNIAILDTLPPNVDPRSLRVLFASAQMNIALFKVSGYNIVKFDFPHINLLDSSHHGQCDGMVAFKIKLIPDLPNGTTISNSAGIYFDYNPVVITNTVSNVKGCPSLKIVINKMVDRSVEIFPNPATTELTIKADNEQYHSFTITDQLGRILISKDLSSSSSKIDIRSLPSGIYHIMLIGEKGTTVQKFTKL